MCTNESINNLMLDALRRGILFSHRITQEKGARTALASVGASSSASASSALNEQKKRLGVEVERLSPENKIQVALAVVRIAGFEAIGAYNNGCFVDVTDWTVEQIKRISDIVQYCDPTKINAHAI